MVDALDKAMVVLLHGSIDTWPWCQVPERERVAQQEPVVDASDKARVVLLHGSVGAFLSLAASVRTRVQPRQSVSPVSLILTSAATEIPVQPCCGLRVCSRKRA